MSKKEERKKKVATENGIFKVAEPRSLDKGIVGIELELLFKR